MVNEIKNNVREILPRIIELRHKIHMNPELSFEEKETAALIRHELDNHGIEYRSGIAGTGILGEIKGKKSGNGKTLLIRADMDALPICEKSGINFDSQNKGVMHACGHDIHTSVLLCCAIVLNKMRDMFSGTVKFMFQPGEETTGGAEPMIRDGILENPKVDSCIALHVEPSMRVGTAGFKSGAFYACPDEFDIVIKGKGGHAATPQKCADPVIAAAQIIMAIDSLPGRLVNPLDPAAVSVCMINGGSAYNVIPDSVRLGGSVRVFSESDRKLMEESIGKTANEICSIYGAECEYEYRRLFLPLINNDTATNLLKKSAAKYVKTVTLTEPTMAGEDFSFLTDAVKFSALFWLGCSEDNAEVYPLHSERFFASDKCIEYGAEIFCDYALEFLN